MYRLLSVALAFWLAACSSPPPGPATPTAVVRSAPSQPGRSASVTARESRPVVFTSLLSRRCGDATLDIEQSPAGFRQLRLERQGASVPVQPPHEMDSYVPVGLACATSRDSGRVLFVVEYGEREAGCQVCEWRFIVDEHGTILNHATPPLLGDEADPATRRPNNTEYEAVVASLGLDEEPITYLRN